jgi:hypothetical protein
MSGNIGPFGYEDAGMDQLDTKQSDVAPSVYYPNR